MASLDATTSRRRTSMSGFVRNIIATKGHSGQVAASRRKKLKKAKKAAELAAAAAAAKISVTKLIQQGQKEVNEVARTTPIAPTYTRRDPPARQPYTYYGY